MQHDTRHVFEFGPFRLDPVDRLLWRHQEVVPLAPKAVEMLLLFVESSGRVLSKEDLMRRLWPDTFVEEANLSHQVYKLREALGADGAKYIETIARRGYRFAAPARRRLEPVTIPIPDGEPLGGMAATAVSHGAPAVIAFPAVAPREEVSVPRPETAPLAAPAPGPVGPQPSSLPRRDRIFWRAVLPWSAAAVLAGVVVVNQIRQSAGAEEVPLHLTVELSTNAGIAPGLGPAVVISPDGSTVAFRGQTNADAPPKIFIRRLAQNDAVPLLGTDNVNEMFFSPDGLWIGFSADGKLKKIPVAGGDVVTLCDVALFRGGTWTRDGDIVFAPSSRGALLKIRDGGGKPEPFTTLNATAGEITHRFPQVMPDGRTVIFTAHTNSVNYDDAVIMAQPTGGPARVVLRGGYAARYVRSGHLLFIRNSTLFAAPFDAARLEVTGKPAPVVERVRSVVGSAGAQFSVSDNGTLIYLPGQGADVVAPLVWLDASGRIEPLRMPAAYLAPKFSPDGRRLAFQISTAGRSKIWIHDLDRDVMSRLTADGDADEVFPLWTPDGRRIVFSSDRDARGRPHLFIKQVDASDPPLRLTDAPRTEQEHPDVVLPDGTLIFTALSEKAGTFSDILKVSTVAAASGKPPAPEPILNTRYGEGAGAVSRDGHWFAYQSNETGRSEVFVRRFPELDSKQQVSADGGNAPTWSPAGDELFYRSADQTQIMVVEYRVADGSLNPGKPRPWSSARLANVGGTDTFGVYPDGQRMAIVQAPAPQTVLAANRAVMHQHLFAELRRVAN